MNSSTPILRSTFGRRIFLLFVACALLPVGSLAFLSYRQMAGELGRRPCSACDTPAKMPE